MECSICLSDSLTDPVKTDCGHTFCKVCLDKWAFINNKCPNCRTLLRYFPKRIHLPNYYQNIAGFATTDPVCCRLYINHMYITTFEKASQLYIFPIFTTSCYNIFFEVYIESSKIKPHFLIPERCKFPITVKYREKVIGQPHESVLDELRKKFNLDEDMFFDNEITYTGNDVYKRLSL